MGRLFTRGEHTQFDTSLINGDEAMFPPWEGGDSEGVAPQPGILRCTLSPEVGVRRHSVIRVGQNDGSVLMICSRHGCVEFPPFKGGDSEGVAPHPRILGCPLSPEAEEGRYSVIRVKQNA